MFAYLSVLTLGVFRHQAFVVMEDWERTESKGQVSGASRISIRGSQKRKLWGGLVAHQTNPTPAVVTSYMIPATSLLI